jgi:hypothetical protein
VQTLDEDGVEDFDELKDLHGSKRALLVRSGSLAPEAPFDLHSTTSNDRKFLKSGVFSRSQHTLKGMR